MNRRRPPSLLSLLSLWFAFFLAAFMAGLWINEVWK